MAGLIVFPSLAEALRAGYTPCDRIDNDYVVHAKTSSGWARAIAKGSDKKPIR
jgi:methylphosphotriester-DNA--protein-cysteine methyltransferase